MLQTHPPPAAAVGVSPAGSVSLTVTTPLVGPPPMLVTVSVYVAPTCPWRKLPVCVLVRARSEAGMIVVGSDAVLLAGLGSPTLPTVAVLVTEAGAFTATLTVSVMEVLKARGV